MSEAAFLAVDWGTTNRRAWAFASDGRILDQRSDGEGLLSVTKDGFPRSFAQMTRGWRRVEETVPVLMCGMVGSKLGWIEAPYRRLPVDLEELANGLYPVPGARAVWIVEHREENRAPDRAANRTLDHACSTRHAAADVEAAHGRARNREGIRSAGHPQTKHVPVDGFN